MKYNVTDFGAAAGAVKVQTSAREGCEDQPFLHADHFRKIEFDHVTVTGYTDPVILSKTEGEIVSKDSTPIRFVLTDVLHDRYV